MRKNQTRSMKIAIIFSILVTLSTNVYASNTWLDNYEEMSEQKRKAISGPNYCRLEVKKNPKAIDRVILKYWNFDKKNEPHPPHSDSAINLNNECIPYNIPNNKELGPIKGITLEFRKHMDQLEIPELDLGDYHLDIITDFHLKAINIKSKGLIRIFAPVIEQADQDIQGLKGTILRTESIQERLKKGKDLYSEKKFKEAYDQFITIEEDGYQDGLMFTEMGLNASPQRHVAAGILTYTAPLVRSSALLSLINENLVKKDPIKEMRVYAWYSMVWDEDIISPGMNLAIVSPCSYAEKDKITIDLSGKAAPARNQIKAANGVDASDKKESTNGQNGLPGLPGQSAGNLLYITSYIDSSKFNFILNGGNGSLGQNGGDGGQGKDGKIDYNEELLKEYIYNNSDDWGYNANAGPYKSSFEKTNDDGPFWRGAKKGIVLGMAKVNMGCLTLHDNTYKVSGSGGLGGYGGMGGRNGKVTLLLDTPPLTRDGVSGNNGLRGDNGKDGLFIKSSDLKCDVFLPAGFFSFIPDPSFKDPHQRIETQHGPSKHSQSLLKPEEPTSIPDIDISSLLGKQIEFEWRVPGFDELLYKFR